MKKNLFLMIAVLAASPVMGQDAKQIADSLSIPPVKAGAKQLPMPSVSGAQIKLLGADYEKLQNAELVFRQLQLLAVVVQRGVPRHDLRR